MGKLIKYQFSISVKKYKTLFVALFILLLPIIRYVDSCYQIGVIMDKWLAFGAMIMFADLYMVERQYNTIDMFYLATQCKKASIIIRAIESFLTIFILTVIMYIFCLFRVLSIPPLVILAKLFVKDMLAFSLTILFWGILAFTISNITKNTWTGLALTILLWFILTSSLPIPDIANIFSYEKNYSYWYISKFIYSALAVVLFFTSIKMLSRSPYDDR